MTDILVSQDRWALIEQFIAHWHRPLVQEDGFSLAEIHKMESQFECPFPLALREWYLLAGKRDDLNAALNYLLPPQHLQVSDEHLVFFLENQSAVRWGVRLSDLGMADPPVYLDGDFSAPTAPPSRFWILENATLSEFLFQMILLHTLVRNHSSQETFFYGCAEIDSATVDQIATLFPRFELPAWHWPVYPTQFFGTDEVLLMVDGSLWLWIVAQSASALKKLEEAISLTWINLEGPFF